MRFDSEEDTQFEDSDATEYDPFPLGARVPRVSRRIAQKLAPKPRAMPPLPPPPRRPRAARFDPGARQVFPAPIKNLMLPLSPVAHDQRYVMTERVPKVSLSQFSYRSWAQRLVAPILAAAIVLGVVLGIALTGGDTVEALPMALAVPAKAPAQRIVVTAIVPEPPAPVVTAIEEAKPVRRSVAKPTKPRRHAVAVDASTALGFLRPR